MANGNHNHVIISCPWWVWDDDFFREGTVPSSLFMQFLAHQVPVKTENKIQWEGCLCFQWERWPVPAESKALAELLCEHTSVQQLWVWRKQHSPREGPNLIYVHHFHSCPEMMMWSWAGDAPCALGITATLSVKGPSLVSWMLFHKAESLPSLHDTY